MFKNHLIRLVLIVGLLACLSASPEVETLDQQLWDPAQLEDQSAVAQIEARLSANEYEEVVSLSKALIEQIEQESSRYDEALIDPLVLLGDGSRATGEYVEALGAYERARHLTRLAHGLRSLEQVDVVYREADTYLELGQISRANDRHEYAYSMYVRSFEPFSTDLLPGLFKLADWYTDTENIFAARGLYEYASKITARHLDAADINNRRALKGLARTYRLERFRPPRTLGHVETLVPKTYWADERPYVYYAEVNNYAPGAEALVDLVKIEMDREGSTTESIAYAKLELADWFLLFAKYRRARIVYEDIWKMFEDNPDAEFLQKEFSKPIVLYYPLPMEPAPLPVGYRAEPTEGTIELSFNVLDDGTVKDVQLVHVEPTDRFVSLFKGAMRSARYRPLFQDGKAEGTKGVTVTHKYYFYPNFEDSS